MGLVKGAGMYNAESKNREQLSVDPKYACVYLESMNPNFESIDTPEKLLQLMGLLGIPTQASPS